MNEIKWIKLEVSLFENEKIRLIEANYKKQFDYIIAFWIRLLCLAGKQNNQGYFVFSNGKPYTIETFSKLWNIRKDKVNTAISVLVEFGMLEVENDAYVIKNWGVYQTLDKWEKKKERDREYHRLKRAKEKEEQLKEDSSNDNVARQSFESRSLDIDIDKNKNKNKNNNTIIDNQPSCLLNFDKQIKDDWCYSKCKYYNECKIKNPTIIKGKKIVTVPDWFKEAQEKEERMIKEITNNEN